MFAASCTTSFCVQVTNTSVPWCVETCFFVCLFEQLNSKLDFKWKFKSQFNSATLDFKSNSNQVDWTSKSISRQQNSVVQFEIEVNFTHTYCKQVLLEVRRGISRHWLEVIIDLNFHAERQVIDFQFKIRSLQIDVFCKTRLNI